MGLKSKVEKVPGYNKLVLPVHYLQAVRAVRKNGHPAKNLRVIGVTGTNGKTTTCFMIWKMLNESGRKAGLLTTVGWSEDGADLHQQIEHMTTERVGILNERIRAVKEAGAEFLVLEVTSHALAQFRTLGIPIEIAVLTNVTHEHLDYHGTFENYRKAKLKLFRGAGTAVINADDESADVFSSTITSWKAPVRRKKVLRVGPFEGSVSLDVDSKAAESGDSQGDIITYGIEKGDWRATEIELGAEGVKYAAGDIKSKEKLEIRTQIPGRFNVYNSLAAVAVGKKLGLSDEEIERGIFALEEVEGRMTRVREGQEFEVIIDYAHTPDALENVFSSIITASDSPVRGSSMSNTASLRASNLPCTNSKIKHSLEKIEGDSGRIIAVHGGAGRRDESTREIRGMILGKMADIVVITEDDSRDEDPEMIAADFVKGAEKAGKVLEKDLFIEMDREEAIRKVIEMARSDDVVMILGKGHEKTILRADGAHEFQDVEVARKILKKMKNKEENGDI